MCPTFMVVGVVISSLCTGAVKSQWCERIESCVFWDATVLVEILITLEIPKGRPD